LCLSHAYSPNSHTWRVWAFHNPAWIELDCCNCTLILITEHDNANRCPKKSVFQSYSFLPPLWSLISPW
jgi:hypothetical protein